MGAACSTQSGSGGISAPEFSCDASCSRGPNGVETVSASAAQDLHHVVPPKRTGRRGSVSAEVATMSLVEATQAAKSFKLVPKSDEAKARIKVAMQHSFLFKGLEEEKEEGIVDAMFERNAEAGETIITEGEEGDNYYVIETGKWEALKGGVPVFHYDGHGAFGELALLYNCPRAATVQTRWDGVAHLRWGQAVTGGVLWGVDRATFRTIVFASTAARRERFEEALEAIPLFKALTAEQRSSIADCLEAEAYKIGEYVVREGDPLGTDAKFYLVEAGTVHCLKSYEGSKRMVAAIEAGGFFGEVGLVTHAPRAADCVAASEKVKLLSMGREAFQRLMGPVDQILAEKVKEYASIDERHRSTSNVAPPPKLAGASQTDPAAADGVMPAVHAVTAAAGSAAVGSASHAAGPPAPRSQRGNAAKGT